MKLLPLTISKILRHDIINDLNAINSELMLYGRSKKEELKAKIFGENFAYGETGGTGLGLYIVKKAMENYGGHVRVEENTPRGAVFVLALRKVR